MCKSLLSICSKPHIKIINESPEHISIIEMSYLLTAMNYNYQLDYLGNVCHEKRDIFEL